MQWKSRKTCTPEDRSRCHLSDSALLRSEKRETPIRRRREVEMQRKVRGGGTLVILPDLVFLTKDLLCNMLTL